MGDIIIQIAGGVNLILNGILLEANLGENYPNWTFQLLEEDDDNTEIFIPSSSDRIQSTATIRIAGTTRTLSFWSIENIDSKENIFRITEHPNKISVLNRNR